MYKRLLQCFQHFAKKCLEHKIFILSIFLRPLGKKLLGKIVVLIRTGSRIQQGHYPSRSPGPVFLYLLINFSTAVPLDPHLTREEGGRAWTGEEGGVSFAYKSFVAKTGPRHELYRPEYYPNYG